ncbi:MAG: dTDP-4-dehydrorhamnose 3,5-epimerase family protein [Desulfovibrionaceae bacterium]|nr:dTDP-4-dehydrorhamnose 3,5-epimerase family protein [Desulfovibrionaceae bacterium]
MDAGIMGVALQELAVIPTDGGPVLRMLRPDWPLFAGFGELYFSEVLPGAVKAWKRHSLQTQHLAVPVGRLKLAIYDSRPDSASFGQTREYILGRPDRYRLLRIPPGLWYGFTAIGPEKALVCNCADLPHDPAESSRKPWDSLDIPYSFASLGKRM